MGKSDQGVQGSPEGSPREASVGRYDVIPRVLVFMFNGDDVLLLKGAPTKRIWANLYNGVGGHVEPREDVYTAALRETREETGLDVHDLQLRGIANIDVGPQAGAGTYTGIMLFVFSGRSHGRETRPSREGTLEWVPLNRLDAYDLVEDLPVVLGRIRAMSTGDPPFFARYAYDGDDRLQITFAHRH